MPDLWMLYQTSDNRRKSKLQTRAFKHLGRQVLFND